MKSDSKAGVPSASAEEARTLKRKHHAAHHLQSDLRLTTLAFETYGRETDTTADFIRAVCMAGSGLERGWQHHPFTRRWRCRIHTALQVGNARLIRRHLQHHYGMPMCAVPPPGPAI